MKIRKEALRTARQLLKASMPEGRVDEARAKSLAQRIIAEKPRYFVQILAAFQRLLKLEIEKRHAVIESAQPLSDATREEIVRRLKRRFGADLSSNSDRIPISSAACASKSARRSGMARCARALNRFARPWPT